VTGDLIPVSSGSYDIFISSSSVCLGTEFILFLKMVKAETISSGWGKMG
jgi:hypothetical protein